MTIRKEIFLAEWGVPLRKNCSKLRAAAWIVDNDEHRFMGINSIKFCCSVAAAVLLVLGAVGWGKYVALYTKVALGEEQIRYFCEAVEESRTQSNTGDIQALSGAVTNYYPSGTKQRIGSHVDSMVERCRALALQVLNSRTNQTQRRIQ